MKPESPGVRGPQVLVVGEALFDDFGDMQVAGGAPYNVARHLAGFGLSPVLISRVGDDLPGRAIGDEMRQRGMSTEGLQTDASTPTGRVRVVADADGGHDFVIESDAAWDRIEATPDLRALAARTPWMCFGTLALRASASHAAWQALCNAHADRRFLDLNWRAGHLCRERALQAVAQCDVMKLSDAELHMLLDWHGLGGPVPAGSCVAGAHCTPIARLLAPYGVSNLVVTLGAAGWAWFDRNGLCRHAGAAERDVQLVDSVGAGDAFSSVVLLGLVLQWDTAQMLERANRFAAAICAIRGAVPDGVDAYLPWRARWGLV